MQAMIIAAIPVRMRSGVNFRTVQTERQNRTLQRNGSRRRKSRGNGAGRGKYVSRQDRCGGGHGVRSTGGEEDSRGRSADGERQPQSDPCRPADDRESCGKEYLRHSDSH